MADQKTEYQSLTTTEAKIAAIETAETPEQLDAMWEAWAERGLSATGIMRARVLRAKQNLGVELTEAHAALVAEIEKRAKEGAKLPPIQGEGGL